MMPVLFRIIVVLAVVLMSAGPVRALTDGELKAIEFEQHPGRRLSLATEFRDESGKPVRLEQYFHRRGRPVILVPGYFRCEMLCSGVSEGLLRALQGVKAMAGSDYEVVYISIDPAERTELARQRKRTWERRYGRPGGQAVFLSGGSDAIATVTGEIGFGFRYDSVSGEYAHPAGFAVVTPEGTISRYFLGVSYSAGELDTALRAASRERTGGVIRNLVLLCFHYDPKRSVYGNAVMVGIRVMGLVTLVGLGVAIASACRGQKREET